jgi:hypothetical protein
LPARAFDWRLADHRKHARSTSGITALAIRVPTTPHHVLGDDRLDWAAHPVGGLALGHPDGLEQFVDVARLDLRDRQLPDSGVGVRLSEEGHWSRCFSLQVDHCARMQALAHSSNVGAARCASIAMASWRTSRRSWMMSTPAVLRSAFTRRRAASRASRAFLRDTSLKEPRPCQRSLPSFQ